MNDIQYLPIGVAPHWVVQNERILKLSEAINRYATFLDTEAKLSNTKECYECIEKWADELKLLAKMEIQLLTKEIEN